MEFSQKPFNILRNYQYGEVANAPDVQNRPLVSMNAQRYDQEVHFPKSGKSTQNPPPKWLLTTSLIISQIIGFRAMVIRDGNDLLISPNNTYYSTFDLYLFSSEIVRGSIIGYIVRNRGHYCT